MSFVSVTPGRSAQPRRGLWRGGHRSFAPSAASSRPTLPQLGKAHDLLSFPGEDAPGVLGTQRRMPAPQDAPRIQSAPLFPQLSTVECYEGFPAQVKSSCPVSPVPGDPAGRELLHQEDAGPITGQRHRPEVAIARTAAAEVPESVEPGLVEYNRRILEGRKGEQ